MSSIGSTGTAPIHRSSWRDPEPIADEGSGSGAPRLQDPGGRAALAVGLEQLVALLSEETAKEVRKEARLEQRAARNSQQDALERQVKNLHEKADDVETEGAIAGWMAIGGGAISMGPEKGATLGKSTADAGGSFGKLYAGGDAIRHDAEATRAGGDAKRAESLAEEYSNLAKGAESTMDKAHQALQALVQGRMQLNQSLAIYRGI